MTTAAETTTAIDDALIGLHALAGYLAKIIDVETYTSRWVLQIADDLYRRTYGEIEFDSEHAPTGRYAAIEARAEERVREVLRRLAS